MGQAHFVINLDRKEFLDPHSFDDGYKLLEFGSSGSGTMLALAVLLANSPNRGGGDLRSDNTAWYGRWAGQRIVIAGDYAEAGDPGENKKTKKKNNYARCREGRFKDISDDIIEVIREAGEDIGVQS